MKEEFSLSAKDSQLFLKYFNSILRDHQFGMIKGNGSSYFKNNEYITEESVNYTYNGKDYYTDWLIKQKPDGTLMSIENLNTVDDDGKYDLELSQIINKTLQKVINKKTETFFKRTYYRTISGCNLPGEYWFNKTIRFAPLFSDDKSSLVNAERIVVVDLNVDAIDTIHANEIANEKSSILISYLSFILDISFELPNIQELYFLNRNSNNKFEMERKSTQLIDNSNINKMPKKGELCSLGKYKDSIFDKNRYLNRKLICPKETRKIINGIEKANDKNKLAFQRCCLLYKISKKISFSLPTAMLSYEYAAVDSIVKTLNDKYPSFSFFMTKYAGENQNLYDFIHSDIRSAHFHSGKFSLGDFDFNQDFIRNPQKHITFNIIKLSHEIIRKAILNWLDELIKFS